MRVCYGVDGLPRCTPSLPFVDRSSHAALSPTPEDWAYVFANRNLFLEAAARVFTWRMRYFTKADLLHAMAPAILAGLRSWEPDRGASKSTRAYNAARYQCLAMLGDMYPYRSGPKRSRMRPPVAIGEYSLVEKYPPEPDAAKDEELLALLPRLKPRESGMLTAYYGLDGKPPLSMKRVGEQFGITTARVRQVIAGGECKIRYAMCDRLAAMLLRRARTAKARRRIIELKERGRWDQLLQEERAL